MADDTKLHSEGVFDYARDNIEVPAASFDKIARTVITRFNDAARWQTM